MLPGDPYLEKDEEEEKVSDWFGKGCKHQCNKWEDSDHESLPVLTFCNHSDNGEETEGNCREKICPLLLKGADKQLIKLLKNDSTTLE